MDMCLRKLREMVKDREAGMLQYMGLQRVGDDWDTEQQLIDYKRCLRTKMSS